MANNKKLLLFHIAAEKRSRIEALCRELEIQTVAVALKQYGECLGALAGVPGIPAARKEYQGEELAGEMLVFSGINQQELDTFLKKYRERSIEPVELKAVITPHNIFWSAGQLYEELFKEHCAFKKKE